jgi:dihydroorotase
MIEAGFGRLTDPPASLLVAGVRIVDPASGTDEVRDLGIVDGLVMEAADVPASALRIDGHGLIAAPGFCDLHTHLREPGDGSAETIASGTRAAAHGGYTTVCAMPNTDPPIDDPEAVAALSAAGADVACRLRVIASVTAERRGSALADLSGMSAAGAIGFSDDGASVPRDCIGDALRALSVLDRPLFEHAEDPALAADGVMRAGATASALGLPGWPSAAETSVVERDLALAAQTGARIHLTHLSCAESVEAVRRAKAEGVRVTCDVTPHHLAMAETWIAGDRAFAWETSRRDASLAFDPHCRVNPPLGTREDAAALLAGVADGTVDAIATDHAPHPSERKLVPFDEAAAGLSGLETALSIGLAAVEAGVLRMPALIGAMSIRPAAIIGEARGLARGAIADLVVFDPLARWRVDRSTLASASMNTPLLGMTLPGVVRLTVADGRVTYRS